jgi:hypothetical protein
MDRKSVSLNLGLPGQRAETSNRMPATATLAQPGKVAGPAHTTLAAPPVPLQPGSAASSADGSDEQMFGAK